LAKILAAAQEIFSLFSPKWLWDESRTLFSKFLEMIIPPRESSIFFPPSLVHSLSSDGTCVRDYLHVLDLAAGHRLALDALEEGSSVFSGKTEAFFKAYNLGKGKGMSVLQIVEAMRKATGHVFKYEIIGRR
jgi:nucleoside-diphosphate-sugar epimerase